MQLLVILPSKQAQLVALQVASPLITKIKECQTTDPEFKKLVKKVEEGSIQDFTCKEGHYGIGTAYVYLV